LSPSILTAIAAVRGGKGIVTVSLDPPGFSGSITEVIVGPAPISLEFFDEKSMGSSA
jgi:hypothetical protein